MKFSKKHVETLISKIVKEAIDKELAISNKRRKEFKDKFSGVFTEADVPPEAPPPDPTTGAPGAAPGAAGSPPTPDATTGAPAAVAGAPGTDDPTASGDVGGVDGEDETGDGEPSGSGGGFGGFGGGGGGGGGGEEGTGETEQEEGSADSNEPEEPQGDPIVSMVSGAQELLNQTNDPSLILKSLKGQIQTVFAQPEHALGLIKALYDTQDSILQAVAQRLYLFIKTGRPE